MADAVCQTEGRCLREHTIVQVPVPLLLHGLFEAAVEDLVEDGDPLLHLCFTVCSQQVCALILHLQLEGEPAHFAILKDDRHLVWSIKTCLGPRHRVCGSCKSLLPEPHPCTSLGRWFLWVLWRCSHPCRSWGCRIHPPAGPDRSTSSWRTRGWKFRTSASQKASLTLKITKGDETGHGRT